jgi:hypothetical protein
MPRGPLFEPKCGTRDRNLKEPTEVGTLRAPSASRSPPHGHSVGVARRRRPGAGAPQSTTTPVSGSLPMRTARGVALRSLSERFHGGRSASSSAPGARRAVHWHFGLSSTRRCALRSHIPALFVRSAAQLDTVTVWLTPISPPHLRFQVGLCSSLTPDWPITGLHLHRDCQ